MGTYVRIEDIAPFDSLPTIMALSGKLEPALLNMDTSFVSEG